MTQRTRLEEIYFRIKNPQLQYKCIPPNELIKWYTPCIKKYIEQEEEEIDFLINPPVVQEGIIKCLKCSSKRVFSFSKQTRRGDESTSIFALCSECKYQWKI
jgi:DNA-directed RNA polymerase subunit M/transcription elongation factor TFIIS